VARAAGVPVLGSCAPSGDVDEVVAAAESVGFPVFVKAVAGGGGRGMRRVEDPRDLRAAVETAMREAESAFGDPTVFLERAVVDPRHIEVQVLADSAGEVIHLYERDCSVQRRHQKVLEIAPAPGIDAGLQERICADAVAFARSIGYVNAGTVEFLVDRDGRHVFIEMNPRIQVEHTVTEEVTDVDLVQAQLRIASGESLADLGLRQDAIRLRGAALQCRITTEDPANGFRPDTGRITAYRSPGGAGIRLDGGTTYTGAEVSAYFDSLLTKLTCRGRDFPNAVDRARRALAEFRIRGVTTNLPFLQAVLEDPDFRAGGVTTSFIDTHPQLLTARSSADRGTKLLAYLAEVTVNKLYGEPRTSLDPIAKLPPLDARTPPPGSRQLLREVGPERFAWRLREQDGVAVTDTTFRDAHQSLLATRVRTRDLVAGAGHVARLTPQLWSVEAWGGATYDVALRFLAEDPWERLAALREALPNVCLQMLLRGRNTVGYTPYPTEVTTAFVEEAASTGIDVFRIFDALNDVARMRPAIDAVRESGTAVAEVALCYTGDLSDPGERLYTLDYYLRLAERIVDAGARAGGQGHGRAVAGPGGAHADNRVAGTVRAAGAPAHPRHRGRAAGHAAGGDRRRRGRGGRGERADVGYHQPAVAGRAGRRYRPLRPHHRAGPGRGVRAGAVLGGGASALRAVRIRAAVADRPGVRARDPRRAAVEPAPAGDRARPGREVRADRGHVRRGRPDPRQPGQGDPVQQGGGGPRSTSRRGRRQPGRVRLRPGQVRHPGLGRRVPRR
jgi:pyruvate carboxylase